MTLNLGVGQLVRQSRPRSNVGALGDSCPSGQQMTNTPNGMKCCGIPGTPAIADPCSYFNVDSRFVDNQNAAVAEDIRTSGGAAGVVGQWEAQAGSYPQNIQMDAEACYYSPGAVFIDAWGQQVRCPTSSVIGPAGEPVSTLSLAQLLQTLSATVTAPNVASNAPTPPNVLRDVAPAQLVPNPPAGAKPNALANSAGQTLSKAPLPSEIDNGRTQSPNTNTDIVNTHPAAPALPDLSGVTDWITQNWVLLAAGAAAVFILPSLLKGGR